MPTQVKILCKILFILRNLQALNVVNLLVKSLALYEVWRSHTDNVKYTSLLGYDAVRDPSEAFTVHFFKVICTTPTMGPATSSESSECTNLQGVTFKRASIYCQVIVLKVLFRLIILKNVKTTVCEPATDVVLNQGMQLQVAGLMSRHSAAWRRYSQCVLSNWLQTRDTERRMSLCHVTSISWHVAHKAWPHLSVSIHVELPLPNTNVICFLFCRLPIHGLRCSYSFD